MRSDGEEQRVMEILDRLRTEVKHRGLLLKTFFDDFDKVFYIPMVVAIIQHAE